MLITQIVKRSCSLSTLVHSVDRHPATNMSGNGGAGPGAQELEYNFVTPDYVVVAAVLAITAIIGFYHVWKSRTSKSTREFLVANTGVSTWALILSAAATIMSPGSVIGLPMEAYSNGVQLALYSVASMLGTIVAAYGTVPVLYNLNVSTVNQYLEYRFNRFLRIFPAVMCLLQNSVVAAAITYVTALVLAQATGFSLWLSIFLIAGLCIVYSSLGGFTAVIWTDVFQMLVILAAYIAMFVKGTTDSEGIASIWKQNELGQRTTFFHWTPSPISNYTVWSLVIGNFTIGFLSVATEQSSLQRQLANRDLAGAKRTVMSTVLICKGLNLTSVWIGMSIYAKYRDCDLYTAKRITSRDQITATFAMDIFNDFPGMSGLFVGSILCATLSTLSSIINAFVTVTLTDLVKPTMPTLSDKKTRFLSKVIGGMYGLLIFAITGYGRHFGGIIQTLQSIRGTSIGSAAIIYILGFFFPWATTKGATIGYLVSLVFGSWLSLQYMMSGSPYVTAPMSTRGCALNGTVGRVLDDSGSSFFMSNLTSTTFSPELASPHITADDSVFSDIGRIAPIWFSFMTMTLGLTIGIAVSIFTGSVAEVGTVEANLISPFTKGILRWLPAGVCRQLGVAHLIPSPEKSKFAMATNRNDNPQFGVQHELVLLNKQGIATDDKPLQPTMMHPE